uniref:Uncharacterized protein n=1 Tax=Romanomermis culicivorax TaxID=13658 RepID=A0A915HP28_ROMCU
MNRGPKVNNHLNYTLTFIYCIKYSNNAVWYLHCLARSTNFLLYRQECVLPSLIAPFGYTLIENVKSIGVPRFRRQETTSNSKTGGTDTPYHIPPISHISEISNPLKTAMTHNIKKTKSKFN